MNQEFDCNQLFAQFNAQHKDILQFDKKLTNTSIVALSQSQENGEEQFCNYFSLQYQEPKQQNHIWFDINQQQGIIDKNQNARKQTADSEYICNIDQEIKPEKIRRRIESQKNQTKNIPKNFGKAILAFVQKQKRIVKDILQDKNEGSYKEFVDFLSRNKKQITTIADLRSLWVQNQYESVLRRLSCLFLRKYSLQYIFNSRICNYNSHIKYRQRFLQAIKSPQQFQHIKEY